MSKLEDEIQTILEYGLGAEKLLIPKAVKEITALLKVEIAKAKKQVVEDAEAIVRRFIKVVDIKDLQEKQDFISAGNYVLWDVIDELSELQAEVESND